MIKFYAGIGSRETPFEVQRLMTQTAAMLRQKGYWLRSGGAIGADSAFEKGAGEQKEIFLAKDATEEAIQLAMNFHPAPHLCKPFARSLHGRNSFQILGKELNNPSRFVLCWTSDGCISHKQRTIKTGGTGTAISIASHYRIRIYNLANRETERMIRDWLNGKG